jgi:hypothetical protein
MDEVGVFLKDAAKVLTHARQDDDNDDWREESWRGRGNSNPRFQDQENNDDGGGGGWGGRSRSGHRTEVPWASRYRDQHRGGSGTGGPFFAPQMAMHQMAMAGPQREMTYEEMLALDDRVQKKTKVRAERLPSFEWRHDAEATRAMEPCSICLEWFERGQTICILPCTHRFHTSELVHWFETSGKSTCPVCNVEVNDTS